jgi:hypothetical protein
LKLSCGWPSLTQGGGHPQSIERASTPIPIHFSPACWRNPPDSEDWKESEEILDAHGGFGGQRVVGREVEGVQIRQLLEGEGSREGKEGVEAQDENVVGRLGG